MEIYLSKTNPGSGNRLHLDTGLGQLYYGCTGPELSRQRVVKLITPVFAGDNRLHLDTGLCQLCYSCTGPELSRQRVVKLIIPVFAGDNRLHFDTGLDRLYIAQVGK